MIISFLNSFQWQLVQFEFKLTDQRFRFLKQVAVKVLEKSKIKDKKDVERISREIKILKQLHHPNVV